MTTGTQPTRQTLATMLMSVPAVLLVCLASCGSPAPSETSPHVPKTSAPSAPQAGKDFFEEVTKQSPDLAKFLYHNDEATNQFAMLESFGGGVGVIDYDGDGLLDLVFTAGGEFAGPDHKQVTGYPTRIFKNMGGFVFKDVTDQVLPANAQQLFYSHGVAVCDYDRDGWPDLLITGYGRLALYRNVAGANGGRKFVDVTKEAGLNVSDDFWATSAAFADLDGDGWPDLYVCRYVDWSWKNHPVCPGYTEGVKRDVCGPQSFNAKQHALFRNNGKGGFVDVTTDKETGLRLEKNDPDKDGPKKRTYCGKGMGVVILDLDGDGKPDIFVANDTGGNFLYLNKSTPGHIRLVEAAKKLGVDVDLNQIGNGSMGVDAADIDGTGDPALWITNYEGEQHSLFRMMSGKTNKFFYHNTTHAGLAAIGTIYVGWGTSFLDLDNDGWMDLVISNGHVNRFPPYKNLYQKPVLFRNKGGGLGKFQVVTEQGGTYFRSAHRGRGLAVADLDNDGRPDLVFSNVNASPAVQKNSCDAGNHWLGVTLISHKHADLVGAKVVLELPGHKLTRFPKGGGSYLSAHDTRLLFGLGKETKASRLTVHWPSGELQIESWDDLEIDRYHKLEQGKGK